MMSVMRGHGLDRHVVCRPGWECVSYEIVLVTRQQEKCVCRYVKMGVLLAEGVTAGMGLFWSLCGANGVLGEDHVKQCDIIL